MSEVDHDFRKLFFVLCLVLVGTLLTLPALAGFSVQGTAVEFSSLHSKPSKMHVDLSSNAEMNDVTVQILLLNSSGRPVLKREFAYQKFHSGKTNQYSSAIDAADLPGGKYGVAVGVYSANLASTFYYEDGLSQFTILGEEPSGKPNVTMVDSKINTTNGALGENAVFSMQLRSDSEMDGLKVSIMVEDKQQRIVNIQEFTEQKLVPRETLEYTSTLPKISFKPGMYSLSVRVNGADNKIYLLKENLARFSVSHPSTIRTTGIGN